MAYPLFYPDGRQCRVNDKAVIAAVYHVLKDRHAVYIAVVIKDVRLDLNMLAEHIEAQLLHFKYIVPPSRLVSGEKDTVRPIPLIQQSVEEIRSAVEKYVLFAAGATHAYLALSKV